MSSTSVARQAQGRWMNSSVRPSSSPDAAADSGPALVVPMAITGARGPRLLAGARVLAGP